MPTFENSNFLFAHALLTHCSRIAHAVASIKVKEVEALEKANDQLKSSIDEHLAVLKETEEELAVAGVDLEDAKVNFDFERISLERKLAAAQASIGDLTQREQKLLTKCEQLSEQCNQFRQDEAVAKKEVGMLREQARKMNNKVGVSQN